MSVFFYTVAFSAAVLLVTGSRIGKNDKSDDADHAASLSLAQSDFLEEGTSEEVSTWEGKVQAMCDKWLVVKYNSGEEGMTGSFALDDWHNKVIFTKELPNGCTKIYTAKCEEGIVQVGQLCKDGTEHAPDKRWVWDWFGGRQSTVHPGEVIRINTELGMEVKSADHLVLKEGYVKWRATSTKPDNTQLVVAQKVGKLAEAPIDELKWMNVMVERMWPHLDKAIWKLIQTKVNPGFAREKGPANKLSITEFTLGQPPLMLGPFNVFSTQTGVKMHAKFNYTSHKPIKLKFGIVPLEIKSFHVSGMMVIRLAPLIDVMPVIGGTRMYFLDAPKIAINFAEGLQVLDMPGVKGIVRGAISKAVSKACVLPNVIGADKDQKLKPKLLGVLKVTAHSAKMLWGHDHHNMFANATSDAYMSMQLAAHTWQTPAITKSLTPVWTEKNVQEFAVYDMDQSLNVELMDDDMMSSHDTIGRLAPIKVRDAEQKSNKDLTMMSKEGKVAGSVRLIMQWMDLVPPTGKSLDGVNVDLKVHSLLIPEAMGEAGISATLGNLTVTSDMGTEVEAPPVDAALAGVITRCRAKNMSNEKIAQITGLTLEQLGEAGEFAVGGSTQLRIADYLEFFPKMIYKGDKLELGITNKEGKVVGTSELLLEDVTKSPGMKMRGWATFGDGLKADLEVSVLGLRNRQ